MTIHLIIMYIMHFVGYHTSNAMHSIPLYGIFAGKIIHPGIRYVKVYFYQTLILLLFLPVSHTQIMLHVMYKITLYLLCKPFDKNIGIITPAINNTQPASYSTVPDFATDSKTAPTAIIT